MWQIICRFYHLLPIDFFLSFIQYRHFSQLGSPDMPAKRKLRQSGATKRSRISHDAPAAITLPSDSDSNSGSEAEGGEVEDMQFVFSDFASNFLEGVNLMVKQLLKSPYSYELSELVVQQGC